MSETIREQVVLGTIPDASDRERLRTLSQYAILEDTFGGFANPTATVGLTATNGTATTAMRSDGAPALNQGIAPTWTALHIHEDALRFTDTSAAYHLEFLSDDGAGNPDTAGGGMVFRSNTPTGGVGQQAAFTFTNDSNNADPGGAADDIVRFKDYLGQTIVSIGEKNASLTIPSHPFGETAQMYYGNDADDQFIHEKLSGIETTGNWTPASGTWDFSAVTVTGIGNQGIHVGTSAPTVGRERIWIDTDDAWAASGLNGTLKIDWFGDGTWKPILGND